MDRESPVWHCQPRLPDSMVPVQNAAAGGGSCRIITWLLDNIKAFALSRQPPASGCKDKAIVPSLGHRAPKLVQLSAFGTSRIEI